LVAWSFVVFLIVHLYIVLFDSHQYKNGLITSIVAGYKFYEKGDIETDRWAS
jgi:Ni,Fe-hydrogenase I cytochrome b subunit